MNCFFTLIYIVPNRFSNERIAVGVLLNLDGVPYFAYSERKFNFALHGFSSTLKTALRKGFYYMDWDVNKIRRGEEPMSLFDQPYAKKLLQELTTKKRGVIHYSDLFELDIERGKKTAELVFIELYQKFMGEAYSPKEPKKKLPNFRSRVKNYISHKKFEEFIPNFKLTANDYPFIYKDMTVDLCRKSSYYTVFYSVDFSATLQTIQTKISQFRVIVQSLQQVSATDGLSSGRYYVVYESTSSQSKIELINHLKAEKNLGFKLIRLSEMTDKV